MEKRNIQITIETATRWYNGHDDELKALAIQTYPELDKPKWAKSWVELGEIKGYYSVAQNIHRIHYVDCHYSNVNIVPVKLQSEAILALSQLLQLRHQMVGEWYPAKSEYHFCVLFEGDEIIHEDYTRTTRPLSFQNEEQAQWFIEHHSELIKRARILL